MRLKLKPKCKLVLGDGLEVLKNMRDDSVDLIVTDPPYNVSANHVGGSINKVKKLNKSLKDLVTADIDNGYDIEAFGEEFIRVMKGVNIYVWCNKVQIPDYFKFYVGKYKCRYDILCWHKTNALPTYSNKLLSDTEYCLYFRSSGKCKPESYEDAKTYYFAQINKADKQKYGHPTVKPLDFIERLVRNSSNKGDLVFDPFMGSGTMGVAALNNGRRFYGVEINPEFYKVAKRRIKDET